MKPLFLLPAKGGLAQLARAFAWHARGHRFDSGNLHQTKGTECSVSFLMYDISCLYTIRCIT